MKNFTLAIAVGAIIGTLCHVIVFVSVTTIIFGFGFYGAMAIYNAFLSGVTMGAIFGVIFGVLNVSWRKALLWEGIGFSAFCLIATLWTAYNSVNVEPLLFCVNVTNILVSYSISGGLTAWAIGRAATLLQLDVPVFRRSTNP